MSGLHFIFATGTPLAELKLNTVFMENMNRVRKEIEEYIFENGREYGRLLMSKTFHDKLEKRGREHHSKIDLPNLEIKENVKYDFKLLP